MMEIQKMKSATSKTDTHLVCLSTGKKMVKGIVLLPEHKLMLYGVLRGDSSEEVIENADHFHSKGWRCFVTQTLITLQGEPHTDFRDPVPAWTRQPVAWVGRPDLGNHTVRKAL